MKKHIFITIAAMCSLVLLTGCGGNKEVVEDTEDTAGTTVSLTIVTGDKIEATKEQCLEMVAFGMKVMKAQTEGDMATAAKLAQEWSEYESTLSAQNVEYEESCAKHMTDQEFMEDIQKIIQAK